MFEPIHVLVAEFDQRLAATVSGTTNAETDPSVICEQDRRYNSYKFLIALLPKLEAQLMETNVEITSASIAAIQKAANEARGDDIRRIKEELAFWLNDSYALQVGPEPFSPKTRQNRGLQNYVTGRLLCPIEYDWSNETVHSNIRDSAEGFLIDDNYFLGCLYPDKLRGISDINLEEDFLRGHLLRKAFAAIFKSPSSVELMSIDAANTETASPGAAKKTKSAKATKNNVATLLNMNGKVTPRSIAYMATLVVFNLSDATQWPSDGVYNGFDYHAFYNFIIDYFEVVDVNDDDSSKVAVQDLLKWWTKSMFPSHAKTKKNVNAAWAQLITNRGLRQRARKEVAAAAAAAAAGDTLGVPAIPAPGASTAGVPAVAAT